MVTQQVSLYNTGMKQLLMYIHEKTLQKRQQALFLEFHSKGTYHKTVNCFLHMLASAKEKKAAHRPIRP